ncbi:MAG: hypothetical protein Q4D99_03100, partial [Bacillota bacterium]|nr:hypothetical protein [Bacillota bacterium]
MINIAGASEGRVAPIITEILKEKKGQCLIVVPTLNRAKRLQTDLSFFSAMGQGVGGGFPRGVKAPPRRERGR